MPFLPAHRPTQRPRPWRRYRRGLRGQRAPPPSPWPRRPPPPVLPPSPPRPATARPPPHSPAAASTRPSRWPVQPRTAATSRPPWRSAQPAYPRGAPHRCMSACRLCGGRSSTLAAGHLGVGARLAGPRRPRRGGRRRRLLLWRLLHNGRGCSNGPHQRCRARGLGHAALGRARRRQRGDAYSAPTCRCAGGPSPPTASPCARPAPCHVSAWVSARRGAWRCSHCHRPTSA